MWSEREEGFSLLEVVIAFAITALFIVTLVEVYSSKVAIDRKVQDTVTAVEIAEDAIASLGTLIPLEPGSIGPQAERGLVWSMEIESGGEGWGAADGEQLLDIHVSVRDGATRREVLRVSTVRPRMAEQGRAR